ncbi:MAG: glutamine synthetase, partial [Syntrophobacteraceae bacterium]|nr:glutamine synthetase [Syntrophobacteraceae bacterium]
MFSCKDPEDVLKITREKEVASIQFWFTDVLGQLKSFSVTPQELSLAFAEGMGFDGSSIEGFARIEESDMVAFPDPTTFQLLPWRSNDRPTGRMFCDIFTPEGTPYEGDPRHALKRMLGKAAERGYRFFVGPELEYFYFKSDAYPEILDRGGYFDVTPLDRGGDLRRDTIFALQKMGIDVEYS